MVPQHKKKCEPSMDCSNNYTGVYRSKPTNESKRNNLIMEKRTPCPESQATTKYETTDFIGYLEQRDNSGSESGYNSSRDTTDREREESLDDELCLRQAWSIHDDSGLRSFGVDNE